MNHWEKTALGRVVNNIEETLIALILGLMTLIQFANVVVRYWFADPDWKPFVDALGLPTNLLWALEVTVFLFAWLVLLGASYAVKVRAHLGVDVLIDLASSPVRKAMAFVTISVCIAFAFLLLKGGWDYWAPFANLSPTSGRWFPTGFNSVRGQGWYEVNDIYMPDWLQWLGVIFLTTVTGMKNCHGLFPMQSCLFPWRSCYSDLSSLRSGWQKVLRTG